MLLSFKIFLGVFFGGLLVVQFLLGLLFPFAIRYGSDRPVREWVLRNVPSWVLSRVRDTGPNGEYLCRRVLKWITFRLWLVYAGGIVATLVVIAVFGVAGALK